MTTTSNFDNALFYANLKDTILEVVFRKLNLFNVLKEQPDVIKRRDALSDILTIFSMWDSVVIDRDFQEKRLLNNIEAMIEDYYSDVGNADIVGVKPSTIAMDVLEDLAYTIKPRFKLEDFNTFILDQPLTEKDSGLFATGFDHLDAVIASILVVVKSEMMILDLAEGFSARQKKGKNVD